MRLVLVQCPLSGVGVDRLMGTSHMGPGAHYTAIIIVLHMGCVMLSSFSVMYTIS